MDNSQNQQPGELGMKKQDRQLIEKNIEKLIYETDYEKLILACRANRILNQAMINKIEAVTTFDPKDDNLLKLERHRRLFRKLTKRGPDAFDKLLLILKDLNHNAAFQRLTTDNFLSINEQKNALIAAVTSVVNPNSAQVHQHVSSEGACISMVEENDENDNHFALKPYDENIKVLSYEVKKTDKIHTGGKIDAYTMESEHNRGVLFMVNNIDFGHLHEYRTGAKHDKESMLYLFKELGFTLYYNENMTRDNFLKFLDAVLKTEEVRKTECFVMAVMSHGSIDKYKRVEKVDMRDGAVVSVTEILERFNNGDCKGLINKPKILIFPFCRGGEEDKGHIIRTQEDSSDLRKRPHYSDILICYASLPGYAAYRDIHSGSWYIEDFCKTMAKHAHDMHFEEILKLIQSATSKRRSHENAMQTANFINYGFNKLLFFNPGAYKK